MSKKNKISKIEDSRRERRCKYLNLSRKYQEMAYRYQELADKLVKPS